MSGAPRKLAGANKEKTMVLSVNTNTSAAIALQNLQQTNHDLDLVQNRINTGLAVSGPKDNAAIYAIAQNMRGEVGAYDAVKQSLQRGSSIVDVALAAGQTISDLLVEMKEKVVAASDVSLDTNSRNALNEDFQALKSQIASVIANAKFDGADILDGSITNGIEIMADADAQNHLTIGAENMTLSGTIITLATTADVLTITNASTALTAVNDSLENVNAALARIGSAGKKLDAHLTFVGKLVDSLNTGIGNLVDADLAVESAHLQALQVKQQLGVQAISIANSRPQILLNLFR
jgi:flagellin